MRIFQAHPGDEPPFLTAMCDDCDWAEFSIAEDLAGQEHELRTLAAKHSSMVAPGIKQR